jgi:hypothetical protein
LNLLSHSGFSPVNTDLPITHGRQPLYPGTDSISLYFSLIPSSFHSPSFPFFTWLFPSTYRQLYCMFKKKTLWTLCSSSYCLIPLFLNSAKPHKTSLYLLSLLPLFPLYLNLFNEPFLSLPMPLHGNSLLRL